MRNILLPSVSFNRPAILRRLSTTNRSVMIYINSFYDKIMIETTKICFLGDCALLENIENNIGMGGKKRKKKNLTKLTNLEDKLQNINQIFVAQISR